MKKFKDFIIFSYFRNFVAKSDQNTKNQKTKIWDKQNTNQYIRGLYFLI